MMDLKRRGKIIRLDSVRTAAFLCAFAFAALSPLALAEAQTSYFSYDTPRYGSKVINGTVFYYLLPTHDLAGYSNNGSNFSYPLATGLSVSCAATPISARTGETVLWYSSVTGGSGDYRYFWSGTDGLTGNLSSVYRSYAEPGRKTATVTVISGQQSITVGCSKTVEIGRTEPLSAPSAPLFGISCYAAQENIAPGEAATWLAVVSGAAPETVSYQWSGTDGLTGSASAVAKTYDSAGIKQATIKATAGDRQITASCINAVKVAPRAKATEKPKSVSPLPLSAAPLSPAESAPAAAAPLAGACVPSRIRAELHESVIWQAAAIGGSGKYEFAWSGDDGLLGKGTTISKSYEHSGIKDAAVTISSGGANVTVSCAPSLTVPPPAEEKDTGLLAAAAGAPWNEALLLIILLLVSFALSILSYLHFQMLKRQTVQKSPEAQPRPMRAAEREREREAKETVRTPSSGERPTKQIPPIFELPHEEENGGNIKA